MTLTPLDTGVLKFLDFSVTLVYPEIYTLNDVQDATQTLLLKWPTLASRLNLLRTAFRPTTGRLPQIWAGKHADKSAAEVVDSSNPAKAGDNIKALDPLFEFANGLRLALSGQALFIKTLHFRDATAFRFVIQHCLCDAAGAYAIAQAYCNILSGKDVPGVSFERSPMQLRDEITQKSSETKGVQVTSALVEQTRDIFTWSWRAFVKKGVKLTARNILHPSLERVDDTIFIPREQVEAWKDAALEQKVKVTEHDLLASFIYQSTYDRSFPQDMIVVFSIRRDLQNQTPMHNSCILLPVLIDRLYETKEASHAEVAAELRRTILEARRPEIVSGLMDFHSHSSKRPMIPRYFGRKAPQASVTSWSHLPFYELDARGKMPSFVHGEVGLSLYLKKFGFVLDDVLINWNSGPVKEESGYLIRGRLTPEVWGKMRQALGQK